MEYETPQFFRVMQYAARADRDVIDMVSGNPDWDPPAALRESLRTYADADPDAFQYPPSDGLRGLREEIAARRGVDAGRVIVTNGAGEANYLAMAEALERAAPSEASRASSRSARRTDAGDEVLLADPVYPYYPGKATMLGGEPTLVPVERDGSLDPAAFREAASEETALILLNTPNNPTGAVYDFDAVREVARVAEEHDALLAVDEVYDRFDFSGRFESALGVDSERVIVTSAFSKSLAITGFRVGFAVFPEALVDGARTRHMLVNVAGSRPAQRAALDALRETGPEYYAAARETLRERIATFTDALDAAGAAYTRPDGAFYVLVRFDGFPGTMANVERLIDEAGVAGMPGETFGTARADWIRFALVTPRVEEAAGRLVDYFG